MGIDVDATHRIRVGFSKSRQVSGAVCDKQVPIKLKGKYYKTVARPAFFYRSEC